jgi:dipeptidyl aminopeptidase/acylaminoacyl peptidase
MKSPFLPNVYGKISIIFFWLVACPTIGQVITKKQLTEAEYGLWGTLKQEQLSENGKWVSYRVTYESEEDTLFVVNSISHLNYSFRYGINASFAKEHTFAYQINESLFLKDLNNGNEFKIPNVESYHFSADGQFLVTLEKSRRLVIRKRNTIVEIIEGVAEYSWNNDFTKLGYITQQEGKANVGYITFKGNVANTTITSSLRSLYKTLKWQQFGNFLAFYDVVKDNEGVCFFNLDTRKLQVLKSTESNFPKEYKIAPNQNIPLQLSRDGKKVFFGISSIIAKDTTKYEKGVQIWNANDKILYPARKLKSTVAYPQYLAVWYVESGLVRQISSDELPWVMLTGNQEYALLANPLEYEPQYKWIADMDYYLLELSTGKLSPFLKKQSGYPDMMGISPDGHYITYYKNQDWWIFNLITKEHSNLTKGLNVVWDNRIVDKANELRVFGQAGWTLDGAKVLLYDATDIWEVSLDGKVRTRLTQGIDKQFCYRFDDTAIKEISEVNYFGSGYITYDLSIPQIISVVDNFNGTCGYSILTSNLKVIPFLNGPSAIRRLKKALNSNDVIYVEEGFDRSPKLVFQKGYNKSKIMIAVTNKQQVNYAWGKSEMIHYTNSKGQLLNGALYYPANYESWKTYPLVVRIYEKVAQDVHRYVNPSFQNVIGFNITDLTLNGYAVLQADISYEGGNTGMDAADSVIAGVQKVIDMGVANPARVGLLGQSFGSYEVNFILTQTNLFAAAVSGSGLSDTIMHYFTINTEYNTIDGWRYESQQFRMGFPFYDNKEAYLKNSPILQADKITTPLLTWAGAKDQNVQPRQSEAFYAALRRLKKEHIMLVYPDEGHIIFKQNNQEDLTRKVFDWFGYYLKGEGKADWMESKL